MRIVVEGKQRRKRSREQKEKRSKVMAVEGRQQAEEHHIWQVLKKRGVKIGKEREKRKRQEKRWVEELRSNGREEMCLVKWNLGWYDRMVQSPSPPPSPSPRDFKGGKTSMYATICPMHTMSGIQIALETEIMKHWTISNIWNVPTGMTTKEGSKNLLK